MRVLGAEERARAERRPRLVCPLARRVLPVFFREIEIVGLDHVPRDAPVVAVANHPNGLVDPAFLAAYLPLPPRFLAKHTLWRHPVIRPFLELAAAIPVYRRQDGVDPAKNAETFAACHAVLACRGAIALFPEGRSHDEPALVALKTGVSRIVLEAEAAFGGLGTRIVPVGLTFDDKGRFRSRALMHIGPPVDPAPEVAAFASDPVAAVRSLNDRVRAALEGVTLNYPSWDEARLIRRAAEIFERPSVELPAEASLAAGFALRRTFIEGYESLRRHCPERVAEVARAVAEYDAELRCRRLRDEQVASEYPSSGIARFVLKSLGLLLIRLPAAAVGTAVHAAPYFLVRWIATAGKKEADAVATYKLFASLVIYPVLWLGLAVGAGWAWSFWLGLGTLIAAPTTAWVAMRFHERRDHFLGQARAFLALRGRRSALRRQRLDVLRAVRELAGEYERLAAGGS